MILAAIGKASLNQELAAARKNKKWRKTVFLFWRRVEDFRFAFGWIAQKLAEPYAAPRPPLKTPSVSYVASLPAGRQGSYLPVTGCY